MRLVTDTPQDNGIPEILWDIKDIKPLEPVRGVYFLFLNEQIVYVGQSTNVHARVLQHTDKEFNKVFYLAVPPDMNILAVEKHYILKFRPKYNYETTAKSCEPPLSVEDAAYYLTRMGRTDLRPDHVYLKQD